MLDQVKQLPKKPMSIKLEETIMELNSEVVGELMGWMLSFSIAEETVLKSPITAQGWWLEKGREHMYCHRDLLWMAEVEA